MKKRFCIKSDASGYTEMSEYLDNILQSGKNATVYVVEGIDVKRSLSANALQAVWIKEIAAWQGNSEHYVRNFVKSELGLPILLEDEDSEIAQKISYTLNKIDYDLLSPRQKMGVMEMFSVTSLMTTQQHKRLLQQMQSYYGNAGLILIARPTALYLTA